MSRICISPFETKVAKFWDGLKEQKLLATKCNKCGGILFPPKADCAKCMSSDMEWVELSGEGELATYTVNKVPPESFAKFPSYIIGIVKLKEGPTVMGWLSDVQPEQVKIGMKLKMQAKEHPDGKLTYDFSPV